MRNYELNIQFIATFLLIVYLSNCNKSMKKAYFLLTHVTLVTISLLHKISVCSFIFMDDLVFHYYRVRQQHFL